MVVALIVCVLPGTLWAHDLATKPSHASSARELQAKASRLSLEIRATAAKLPATTNKIRLSKRLVALSNERRKVLEALVVDHPAETARLILPQATRRTLLAIPGAWAESHVTVQGRYRVFESHDHGTGLLDQLVSEDGRTVLTVSGAKASSGVRPNDSIEVSGYRIGNRLLTTSNGIEPNGPRGLTSSATTATVGEQKVAVIISTFSDSGAAVDVNAIRATFEGSPGSDVVSYFTEASYGRMSIAPSFYGPYTLGTTSSAGCSSPSTQALVNAAAADVTFAQFSRLIFVFNCPGISFGSAASSGPVSTPQGTIYAAQIALDARSAASRFSEIHELSHTLGNFNKHAAFAICLPETFIPPTRFDEGCLSGEYGDSFDVLGSPPTGSVAQLGPYHKANSGWFGAGEFPTVTTSGTYTLAPYEQTSASAQPLALNIPRGSSGTSFTVEYRRPLGFDAWMDTPVCRYCTVTQGASIRVVMNAGGGGGGSDAQLLDTTPGTIPSTSFYPVDDGRDGALLPGRTFTDPEYGITITAISADASGLTVLVTVPPQTCVHGTPTVSAATPAGQTGTFGTTSNYGVTVTNTDTAGCAPNKFRYLSYSSSSLSMVAEPDFLALAPGASASVSLKVGALPLTTIGTYQASGVFRSNTMGTGDANVTASYTLSSAADTSAPTTPSGLSASALGSAATKVSWAPADDNVGVVGYRVTRGGAQLTAGETSLVDTGLVAGTAYSYSVQAFDRRGNFSPAATVSVTTPQPTDSSPPTPPNVTATAGDHSLTVSWTKSADNVGIAYYRVIPCLVPMCTVPGTQRSFTVDGLPTRTKWDLQVLAIDGDGNSSNFGYGKYPVYTAAAGTTAPSQPQRLFSPGGGYHRVELSWTASTDDKGVASYAIYRNDRQIASVTGTSYTDQLAGAPSQYHVVAVDGDGSLSAPSARMWFPAAFSAAADSTSPQATVTSPASGTVSGTVEVLASASDNISVTNVELYVDGVLLGYKKTAPYTFSWDTTSLANGTHWVYARAYDGGGNYGTAGVTTVTVANASSGDETPPSVAIETPTSGATVAAPVTIDAAASDNVGVTKVVLAVDGSTVATDTAAPYSASWDFTNAAAGTHAISATAYDAAGNTDRASVNVTRPVTADTTPPTVTVTAPANGATVAGSVAVSASAADTGGVAKVEFSVDGVLASTSTTAPYGFSWNASAASAGSHVISARAYDTAGNSAAAAVSVNIAAAPEDTTVPTTPSRLKALVIGTTGLALSWVASTDNAGVAAYEIYRDGVQIGESTLPNFLDVGLLPGSSHKYTVRARDAAGNRSLVSSALSTRQLSPSTSVTGTIAGVVYNSAGRPLADVIVTLTGNAIAKTAKTGSSGTYKFSSLPAGSYLVKTALGPDAVPMIVVGGVTLVLVSP